MFAVVLFAGLYVGVRAFHNYRVSKSQLTFPKVKLTSMGAITSTGSPLSRVGL